MLCVYYIKERGKMKSRKKNLYIKENDYYVGYFNNSDKNYIIDEDSYEKIKNYNCYYQIDRAMIHYNGKCRSLSKVILDISDKKVKVFHINKNSLDYRKCNLYIGNTYTFYDDYVVGKCFDGQEFLVDINDYDLIKNYKWHIDIYGYALSKIEYNGQQRTIKMHRLIMDVLENNEIEIDHINRNGADNRRENLRFADRTLQMINTGLSSRNKSGIKGVYWMNSVQKWAAQIKVNRTTHYLGCYNTIEEAAQKRREAEQIYYNF